MVEISRDRALRAVEGAHDALAGFARESFHLDGRGITRVQAGAAAPGTTFVEADMVYHTLEQMRTQMGAVSPEGRDRQGGDVVLRMIETYDPAWEAVVMLALSRGTPFTFKMKLDLPFLIADAGGVQ